MAQLPSQLITWMQSHTGSLSGRGRPQFLYALKGTRAGDRQVVWEGGGGGRGLVAVVDFADPYLCVEKRWRSWGAVTPLDPRIDEQALVSDPILAKRFSGSGKKALQGLPKRLSAEQAEAIDRLAGGLPPQRLPDRDPHAGDPIEDWFGSMDIDPEKTFELAVHTSRHLWRNIGFPEPPAIQRRLAPRGVGGRLLIPDLLAPGVVGEVKRSLRPDDGPEQIVRCLDRLAEARPQEAPWRGKLVHGDGLSGAVRARLDALKHQIEVWAVVPGRVRRWRAIGQYP